MMSGANDVLIVGSGASAVHAARTLVDAGVGVRMIDAGVEDRTYGPLVPDAPFDEIRRTVADQHRFFLGEDFEGIPLEKVGAGPQVTPPRRHVVESGVGVLRTETRGFAVLESLALGGLGGAWGAVSFPFTDAELSRCGLDPVALRPHYERVARRVGISGERGEFGALAGPLEALQPAAEIDDNARRVLARFSARAEAFRRRGFHLGRPYLALLTRSLGGRRATRYHDMDFWSDAGGSVWRPSLEVRALRARAGFAYSGSFLARRFAEEADGTVRLSARSLDGGGEATFRGRALVLAAGAVGTARLVLRSLERYDTPLPLVSNPHVYVPCVTTAGFGGKRSARRHSLAQLTLLYDPTGDGEHLVQGQMYSYGSLMLFRLLDEVPLARREALRVLRALVPRLAIWTLQHEDEPRRGQTLSLRRDGPQGDRLVIEYAPDAAVERQRAARERTMARAMRRLGVWPLRVLPQIHGSSVHYGGSLPFSRRERPLTTEPEGRLRGTRAVWIADGAALRYLPAKGLTLTLMANADRIAASLLRRLAAGGA